MCINDINITDVFLISEIRFSLVLTKWGRIVVGELGCQVWLCGNGKWFTWLMGQVGGPLNRFLPGRSGSALRRQFETFQEVRTSVWVLSDTWWCTQSVQDLLGGVTCSLNAVGGWMRALWEFLYVKALLLFAPSLKGIGTINLS